PSLWTVGSGLGTFPPSHLPFSSPTFHLFRREAVVASGSAVAAPLGVVSRVQDLVFPLAIIASVLVILVPLPPALLDVLLAANITIAVIILLTTIYVRTPLDFSIFPSLLLATTLARLVLNVATTRLVLTRAGIDGLHAAGGVITAFAGFVAGDGEIV